MVFLIVVAALMVWALAAVVVAVVRDGYGRVPERPGTEPVARGGLRAR